MNIPDTPVVSGIFILNVNVNVDGHRMLLLMMQRCSLETTCQA